MSVLFLFVFPFLVASYSEMASGKTNKKLPHHMGM